MLCPNENSAMRQVKVDSHYGQTVLLDQCPDCGGIWFDTSELYMAKQGQADRIEEIDAALLQAHSVIKNPERLCPRDQAKLVRFIDPYFPKDIYIERCPLCGGLWLNRGEFTKYQKFRGDKLAKKTASPEPVWAQPAGDKTEALEKLGKFLSMPLDSQTWRPLESEKLSEKEGAALSLVLNVVSLILRFFVRL
jgi:Zn-finger nucleic acid-binding protein